MPVTRTYTHTLAAAEVNDRGNVDTLVRGSRLEVAKVELSPTEARELAAELIAAADAGDAYTAEKAAG
ncbi:hypothetical protein C1N74_05420 [Microbacterium sp. SGAir0570]|uniref:hypothetical protein n=1 Tax=Microbacterium sp. SGAir0570 TaxID=2070348 RepID=UPI0010CD3ABE|nr:hypothetical protein [Microbacterium sp. SGAir0570]QCR39916.1 hypothetical protein C1N74_05420 [Microbacterium sp. SGAir0570]